MGDVTLDGTEIFVSRPGQVVCVTSPVAASCSLPQSRCPLIDARGASRALSVSATRVIVSNVQLSNGRPANGDGGCLLAAASQGITVQNVAVADCAAFVRPRPGLPLLSPQGGTHQI